MEIGSASNAAQRNHGECGQPSFRFGSGSRSSRASIHCCDDYAPILPSRCNCDYQPGTTKKEGRWVYVRVLCNTDRLLEL